MARGGSAQSQAGMGASATPLGLAGRVAQTVELAVLTAQTERAARRRATVPAPAPVPSIPPGSVPTWWQELHASVLLRELDHRRDEAPAARVLDDSVGGHL